MRHYIDCEFIEDGLTIDLVSIGIVTDDGREYYACNDQCDLSRTSGWVKENVITGLPSKHFGVDPDNPDTPLSVRQDILTWKTLEQMKSEIVEFCNPLKHGMPQFWGEWCSYDWVVFCQIFGVMDDLPKGFPMRCSDIVQWAEDHLGITADELPPSLETPGNHNALLGAKTVQARHYFLRKLQTLTNNRFLQQVD